MNDRPLGQSQFKSGTSFISLAWDAIGVAANGSEVHKISDESSNLSTLKLER